MSGKLWFIQYRHTLVTLMTYLLYKLRNVIFYTAVRMLLIYYSMSVHFAARLTLPTVIWNLLQQDCLKYVNQSFCLKKVSHSTVIGSPFPASEAAGCKTDHSVPSSNEDTTELHSSLRLHHVCSSNFTFTFASLKRRSGTVQMMTWTGCPRKLCLNFWWVLCSVTCYRVRRNT